MIGEFFVSLFKINDQADKYYLQAAKINEARMYFSPKYRRQIKYIQYIGRSLRDTGAAFKTAEQGMRNFADASRKIGNAIRNGFTELSKERMN